MALDIKQSEDDLFGIEVELRRPPWVAICSGWKQKNRQGREVIDYLQRPCLRVSTTCWIKLPL